MTGGPQPECNGGDDVCLRDGCTLSPAKLEERSRVGLFDN